MVKLRLMQYLHKLSPTHHKEHSSRRRHESNCFEDQSSDELVDENSNRVTPVHGPEGEGKKRAISSVSQCPPPPGRYVDLCPARGSAPKPGPIAWMRNLNREQAERVLKGRPDGTFLVRPAANGQFALSLVCNGTVVHCMILCDAHGFYGFAEPFIHMDVTLLVHYYMDNTLECHNSYLRTRLLFPAFQ